MSGKSSLVQRWLPLTPSLTTTSLTPPPTMSTLLSSPNQWLSTPSTSTLPLTSNCPLPLILLYCKPSQTLQMDPLSFLARSSRIGPLTMAICTSEVECMFHLLRARLCCTPSMTHPSWVIPDASRPRPLLNVTFGGQASRVLSPNLSLDAWYANGTKLSPTPFQS